MEKSLLEHRVTSTGAKFWKHQEQMAFYRQVSGHSIISTHISPEGRCNLSCSYCSVKKREKHFRIRMMTIVDYVEKLCSRGLKAVILTGGGEPTLYPWFNDLVWWLKEKKGLSVGLITNGTLADSVDVWHLFSWVRISINLFDGWQKETSVPREKLAKDCTLGCSYIWTKQTLGDLADIAAFAQSLGAEYVRVLPDCLPDQGELLKAHKQIDTVLGVYRNPIFFHQNKLHRVPKARTCHQAYFRPYLSEVEGGTVYPCDSLVLNEQLEKFDKSFRICKAHDVLDFLDGGIQMKFDIQQQCQGCVFADNIDMLDDWKTHGMIRNAYEGELKHAEFV